MKLVSKPLFWWLGVLLCLKVDAAPAPSSGVEGTNVVRQELAQAILSNGAEQQELLDKLADTGSTLASDVLDAWTMQEVYLFQRAGHVGEPAGC